MRAGSLPSTTPVNRQNEFGFALGGPVLIPKVYDGRNKSFFHVVYSGFRFRQARHQCPDHHPAAPLSARATSLRSRTATAPVAIYDPTTNASRRRGRHDARAVPRQRHPAGALQRGLAKILPLYPGPINGNAVNNFLTIGAKTFDRDQLNIKIDHAFSDRSRLSGFTYIGTQATVTPELLPMPLSPAKAEDYRSRWVRLTHDYIVSPSRAQPLHPGVHAGRAVLADPLGRPGLARQAGPEGRGNRQAATASPS